MLVVKMEREKRLPDKHTITENLRNIYLLKVVARVEKSVPEGFYFSGRRHVRKLYKIVVLTGLLTPAWFCGVSFLYEFCFLISFEVRLLGRSLKLLFPKFLIL